MSAGLVILSAVFFATYGIWSKLMMGSFGEFNQATVKAVILLAVLIPVGWYFKWFKQIRQEDFKWFGIIALMGGLNQAPYFFGFEHLTVGTATLLFYLALTVGSFILGKFLFGEKIGRDKQTALILAVMGLLVIYKFYLLPSQLLAAGSTILAGVMGATAVVLSKKLSGNYSEIQIIMGYLVAMIITNPILSLMAGEQFPRIALSIPWMAQLGYAASYLIANVSVVAGYKKLDPSIGALIGLSEVVFGAVFGVITFRETVTASLLIGSGLIILAAAWPEIMKLMSKDN